MLTKVSRKDNDDVKMLLRAMGVPVVEAPMEAEAQCAALGTVRTGEARLTRSHFSGPRHIIHAVGPKYQAKYTQAAGSALHGCYRHALQLCRAC